MKILSSSAFTAALIAVSITAAGIARADSHGEDPAPHTAEPLELKNPTREIVIGGGSVAGVYFPAAGAICRVVAASTPNRRCLVESNPNSSTNLERLAAGLLDFAVVQSDWLMHAARGTSLFRPNGPDEKLRAVFSMHAEALTLVSRAGAPINKAGDLRKKRVNLGPAYTYQRILTEALLRAVDLDEDDLAQVAELSATEQFTALCLGELDATAIVATHPSPVLADAMQRCDLRLIPIAGKEIEELLSNRPELAAAVVPGGLYAGAPDDTPTFGLRAILATTTQVEDEIVEAVAAAVLKSLPMLASQHPALAELKPETMASAGIAIPVHSGAKSILKAGSALP